MDTTTHVVMGLGLGGLAMADPVLAQSPAATEAVMIGTLAGSLAPDFDTVFKMKNNATYIRHHRGISHSIPAILIWSLFISAVILPFFPATAALHLWLWTMLAVFLHVFVDIFNAYGTQALRPFSDKWVRLGIINIFDPVIFGAHLVGIAIWILNLAAPEVTFACVYILLFFYYVWRVQRHHKVLQRIRQEVPAAQYINVSPHFRWSWWHIAIRTASHHIAAEVNGADVRVLKRMTAGPFRRPRSWIQPGKIRISAPSWTFHRFIAGRSVNTAIMTRSDSSTCVTVTRTGTIHSSPSPSSTRS